MKKAILLLLLLAGATNAQTESSFNMSITVLPPSAHSFSVTLIVPGTNLREWHCPNAWVQEEWENITFNCYSESFSSHYTFQLEKDGEGNTIIAGRGYNFNPSNELLLFDYTKVLKGRWVMPPEQRHNYNGTIDDLKIYDRPLDDIEVHALYRTGLVAGYHLDEPSGNESND